MVPAFSRVLIRNLPLQQWGAWLPTPATHVPDCSLAVYMCGASSTVIYKTARINMDKRGSEKNGKFSQLLPSRGLTPCDGAVKTMNLLVDFCGPKWIVLKKVKVQRERGH